MSQQKYEVKHAPISQADRELSTNLNSEKIMVQVLNRKAEVGDLNTEVGSFIGKRSNVNTGFQEPS